MSSGRQAPFITTTHTAYAHGDIGEKFGVMEVLFDNQAYISVMMLKLPRKINQLIGKYV
jgi:hypothetical protein